MKVSPDSIKAAGRKIMIVVKVERRRGIAAIYHSRLSDLEELRLPPGPLESSDHFDVYQNYELQAKNRDELKIHLQNNGIGTLIQWSGKAVHQWPSLGFNLSLPKAESFFEKCIMIPMNIFVTDSEAEYICDKIKAFYRS